MALQVRSEKISTGSGTTLVLVKYEKNLEGKLVKFEQILQEL